MENQHRLIAGYRELSEDEIARMNEIKEFGGQLGALIQHLEIQGSAVADPRWVAIGKTHLQQGLMALTRAVAKPEFF
jgi:hypothetical protein